jgi:DNA polymerase-3 subunit delta'
MARRLATSQEARARRSETLREIAGITNLSRAMVAAEHLLSVAKRDAQALSEERDSKERANLLRAYGMSEADKLPPNLRAEFKALEENQKRRNTRALRDGIDRIFTDAESFFRDILSLQLAAGVELTNPELESELLARANSTTTLQTIEILDSVAQARVRLAANVRDLLVLEALCTRFISRSEVAA